MNAPEMPGEVWADYLEEQGLSVEEFRAWLAWGVFLADGFGIVEGYGCGAGYSISDGRGGDCGYAAGYGRGAGSYGGGQLCHPTEDGFGNGFGFGDDLGESRGEGHRG